ncbi:MAG: FkbM family methyltransferase [Ferruginibacter sp.]
MKKLAKIFTLSPALAFNVILVYLKKAIGQKISTGSRESGYLHYFNLLLKNNFTHLQELPTVFKVRTAGGVSLFLRKFPSSDFQVIRQIWTDKEYEVVTNLVHQYLSPGRLNIIDAGANVGYSSVYLYEALKKKYKPFIVAVEPSDDNIAILKMNFTENKIQDAVIEKAGLYNKTCYLDIVKEFRDGKEWSFQVQEVEYETSIKAIQPGDILQANNWSMIDFFKMDIEGAERFLFQDGGYARGFLDKTKIIAIEIHHEYNIADQVKSILLENNFSFFEHGELVIGLNKNFVSEPVTG